MGARAYNIGADVTADPVSEKWCHEQWLSVKVESIRTGDRFQMNTRLFNTLLIKQSWTTFGLLDIGSENEGWTYYCLTKVTHFDLVNLDMSNKTFSCVPR